MRQTEAAVVHRSLSPWTWKNKLKQIPCCFYWPLSLSPWMCCFMEKKGWGWGWFLSFNICHTGLDFLKTVFLLNEQFCLLCPSKVLVQSCWLMFISVHNVQYCSLFSLLIICSKNSVWTSNRLIVSNSILQALTRVMSQKAIRATWQTVSQVQFRNASWCTGFCVQLVLLSHSYIL